MSDTETWFVHARLDEEVGTLVLADVPGKDHDIVADCWDGGKQDHDVAVRRARLIAAAPDLLNGCNALLGLLQLVCGRDDMPAGVREALTNSHRVVEALVSEPSQS